MPPAGCSASALIAPLTTYCCPPPLPLLQIRLWDLDSGECLATFSGHRKQVSALRFSRNGALLASGSKDTDIVVWDVAGEAGLYRLRGHRDQVRAGRQAGRQAGRHVCAALTVCALREPGGGWVVTAWP